MDMISRYAVGVLAALAFASPSSAQTTAGQAGQPGAVAGEGRMAIAGTPGLTVTGRVEPGSIEWQAQDREREAKDRAREAQDREREAKDRERDRAQAERDRENSIYEQGTNALWENRWDRALASFNRLAELKGTRADAALYWKSYAQNRLGQRAEALATVAELTKTYPNSSYIKQAKALEVEMRGPRAEAQGDDELKLLALQGLAQSNSPEAIPLIENLLNGTASPRVKSQALFLLAQTNSSCAREVLKSVAKGSSIPELQGRAIQYLGTQGGAESRATLAEIYGSTTDVDVKRRILRAFMAAGERDRLFSAAQTETNPELRQEAIRQLGAMGANDMLWQMYQKETSADLKRQIINALQVGGNVSRMTEIAKTEKDPDLRRQAIRNLGIMGSKVAGDTLVELYAVEKDEALRRTIINGLSQQGNATALVAMARKEQDMTMKTEIVKRLSNMGDNPVAKAYLLELLK
jgi:HEAT repeat protein